MEKEELSLKVLKNCRNELYRYLPELGSAFAGISYRGRQEGASGEKYSVDTIGTDGVSFYFSADFLLRSYGEAPERVTRGYFHMLLHCLYLHILPPGNVRRRIWDLACDLAAEFLIADTGVWQEKFTENTRQDPVCQKGSGWQENHWEDVSKREDASKINKDEYFRREADDATSRDDICREAEARRRVEQRREEQIRTNQIKAEQKRAEQIKEFRRFAGERLNTRTFSARQLYPLLLELEASGEAGLAHLDVLEQAVRFDDHSLWYETKNRPEEEALRKKWESLMGTCGSGGLGSGGRGAETGDSCEEVGVPERSGYDYRSFLKRFATLREETVLDLESFDYIYYTYGMDCYGNIPLIEPLEYKEGNKLEELAIAIDTSGSCSVEMVRRFLEETYGILGEKENFFDDMNVLFIQCDCCVQETVRIHSEREWREYCKNLKIQGRAGTDFRPVFRYIRKQQEAGEFKKLKALIYFTDGDGIYPEQAPSYETAFVFVKDTPGMKQVPSWALRIRV